MPRLLEAVVPLVHGDGAESLDYGARAEVPEHSTKNAAPVETVVFVKAPVLGSDEGVAHLIRDRANRDVDSAHIFEVTKKLPRPVIHVAAFARMEGPNFRRTRTPVEATGPEP